MSISPTLALVERLAEEAGAILLAGYEQEHQLSYKGDIDLVTEIDRRSEEVLVGELRRQFPDHRILAEEGGGSAGGVFQWPCKCALRQGILYRKSQGILYVD